jgi:hypothetical protein
VIPDIGEVNVSQGNSGGGEVTHSSASSASSSPPEVPLDARFHPELGSAAATSGPTEPSSNNLFPSDSVSPELPSSPSSLFPSYISSSTEPAAAVREGGDVNHYPDHPEGHPDSGSSDDPILPTTASPPPPAFEPAAQPSLDPNHAHENAQNSGESATQFIPSLPVPSTTNHTASSAATTGSSGNMTDETDAKCNRENSSSSSSKYNLSGFRLNTFEAAIWIFILIFVICAVFVLLFVLTIFHRKGNHTFDFQVRICLIILRPLFCS